MNSAVSAVSAVRDGLFFSGVVFAFVESEGEEAILLQTVGTHEEVY